MDYQPKFDENPISAITHGVYIIGVRDPRNRICGSLVDSLMHVTKIPQGIEVATNKETYTDNCINANKEFTVSVLDENTDPKIIELFGCNSCRNIDKWAQVEHEMLDGLPILKNCVASFKVKVFHKLELSSHTLWSCIIENTKSHNADAIPMTMAFFNKNVKAQMISLHNERLSK